MEPQERLIPNTTGKEDKTLASCIGRTDQRDLTSHMITRPQPRPRRASNSISSTGCLPSDSLPRTNYTAPLPTNPTTTIYLTNPTVSANSLFLEFLKNVPNLEREYPFLCSLFFSRSEKTFSLVANVLSILQQDTLNDNRKRQEVSKIIFSSSQQRKRDDNAELIPIEFYNEILRAANHVLDSEEDTAFEDSKENITPFESQCASSSSSLSSVDGKYGANVINTSIGGGDIRESYPIPSAPFLSEGGELKAFYPVLVGDLDEENDDEIMVDYYGNYYNDDEISLNENDDDEDPLMV